MDNPTTEAEIATVHTPAHSTATTPRIAESESVITEASCPGSSIQGVGNVARGRHGGIAARIGGWSARHKKSVLVGWLVFVVLAVVIGGAVGTKTLTQADGYTGQSGKAEQALAKSFPTPAHEETLIHSSKLTVNDPAFQAAIADVRQRVAAVPVVAHLTAATDTGAAGLVSKDRHSALVQFDIKGKIDSAGDRIGPVNAAIRAAQKQNPQLRIEEFGDASVGSQIDKSVQNDLHRAETLSLPVTLIILILAFGALIAAGVPVLLAISGVIATIGLVAIPSHIFPIDDNTSIVITLIGMAVGVDYSLFYLSASARSAGRSRRADRCRDRLGHVWSCDPDLRLHRDGRDGRTVPRPATRIHAFAVGTIMVVAVAMLGSLTALPALLALLGRHVDKGRVRIPFLRRRKPARTESRVWGIVLDRVLARPVIAAVAAVPCCW